MTQIRPLRALGAFAACGALVAALTSLTALPSALPEAGPEASLEGPAAATQEGRAGGAAEGKQEEGKHEEGHEHGELHDSMEVLQQGMRRMRKMLSKPEQKADAIKLVREMQGAALTGFHHIPKPEKELEADALFAFEVDFRKRMLTVCSTLIEIEVALQKEDGDAAKTLYRTLGAQKKEGHQTYIPD